MAKPSAPATTPAIARQLAAELFVTGFPLLMFDAVRGVHPLTPGSFHRIGANASGLGCGFAEDDPRMLQTTAIIDLGSGPMILHVPDMRDRYFAVTLIDSAGQPFASHGSRTRDHGAPDIVLVGPEWHGEIKRAFRARRTPSNLVWVASRIVANSVADVPTAEDLASRQCATPLLTPGAPGARRPLTTLGSASRPLEQQISALPPELFVHRLSLLIERAPAGVRARDGRIIAEHLQTLGGGWSAEVGQAIARGLTDGLAQIVAAAEAHRTPGSSGWTVSGRRAGDAQTPLSRAAWTLLELGAGERDDVLNLTCLHDESGRPLSGEERYRIHFHPTGLPPVENSWRLTAHTVRTPFGLGRPAALCSQGELIFDPDGSLGVLIQADPPPGGWVTNWLPTPQAEFSLHMRLLWPGARALDGTWRMPPVERLGSRVAKRSSRRARPPRPSLTSNDPPFLSPLPRWSSCP